LPAANLFKITKEYFFTPIIVGVNVVVFVIMVLSGVDAFQPSVESLITWGGNLRALTLNGELWRLFTSTFLHGGIFHLLLNMFAALQLGYILETNIGKSRYIISYIATGVLASITSIAFNENTVSVGASGAIFGLDGLLLSLLITKQLNIPQGLRKNLLSSTLFFIGYNLLYGFAKEGIDNSAHIGGLVSGFVIGFIYYPSMKNVQKGLLASAAVGCIVITAAFMSVQFISNPFGDFDKAMKKFGINEERALWMYREQSPLPGTDDAVRFNERLKTEGIDLWQANVSLLNSLTDMPDHLQSRVDLLKRYCALRIQSCETMRLLGDDPTVAAKTVQEIDAEILAVIDQLKALNEE
jgi:rhomboid protease GluP